MTAGTKRAHTFFITGTDTGVGKTHVATALLRRWRAEGRKVCGYKPVATGCRRTREGLRNDDALALQAAAGTEEPYERINPCAYEPAIAPHLAARAAGASIRIAQLNEAHAELAARYERILVEGAGGWRVPLDEAWTLGEWVADRGWPVILVVGMRLGCINHALLSAEAIARRTRLAGWIANVLPPAMDALEGNLETLRARMPAPLLGSFPGQSAAADELDLAPLEKLMAARDETEEDKPETDAAG